MQSTTTAPTTADLVANFVATKPITVCEPAAAANANTSRSQTRAALTKTPAKTSRAVKRAIDETDAKRADRVTTDKPAKSTRAAKPATKSTIAPSASATITASTLAAELNLTPKQMRVILRKHFTKPDAGWAFDKKTADKIRALVNK